MIETRDLTKMYGDLYALDRLSLQLDRGDVYGFFGVYDDMKVIEYLEFFAAAYRIKGPERRKKCEQVLELVDLGYKRDALVTSLSRGKTQRLGLARAPASRCAAS